MGDVERKGEADCSEKLLLPGYQSISADGKMTTEAMIIDHIRARGASAASAKPLKIWKAALPEHAEVMITNEVVHYI